AVQPPGEGTIGVQPAGSTGCLQPVLCNNKKPWESMSMPPLIASRPRLTSNRGYPLWFQRATSGINRK
ncbi:MAG: hypothetical protein O3A29_22640, partial [Planctomycetota bacterium]|nr:hypothetical protein [Planctomycetota bacterium]